MADFDYDVWADEAAKRSMERVRQLDNRGFGNDASVALKQGLLRLPSAVTGLADIPAGLVGLDRPFSNAADALGEWTGIQPSKSADLMERDYSYATQDAKQAINRAWDEGSVGGIAGAYAANPGATVLAGIQSLPSMVAGWGVGGLAGKLGGVASNAARAGLGEGTVMAGQSMANIDESVDPMTAAAMSLGVGVGGAAIAGAGAQLARRLGVTDLDALAVGGTRTAAGAAQPMYTRVPLGVLQEGVFEEMPQSAMEQGAQNFAEGKPITQGMARASVEGALTGGLFGAVGGALPYMNAKPPLTDLEAIADRTDSLKLSTENLLSANAAVPVTDAAVEPPQESDTDLQARGLELAKKYAETAKAEIEATRAKWAGLRDIQQQKVEDERAGAAKMKSLDTLVSDVGQQWQDLGVTDPLDDLNAQRMGMRPTPGESPFSVAPGRDIFNFPMAPEPEPVAELPEDPMAKAFADAQAALQRPMFGPRGGVLAEAVPKAPSFDQVLEGYAAQWPVTEQRALDAGMPAEMLARFAETMQATETAKQFYAAKKAFEEALKNVSPTTPVPTTDTAPVAAGPDVNVGSMGVGSVADNQPGSDAGVPAVPVLDAPAGNAPAPAGDAVGFQVSSTPKEPKNASNQETNALPANEGQKAEAQKEGLLTNANQQIEPTVQEQTNEPSTEKATQAIQSQPETPPSQAPTSDHGDANYWHQRLGSRTTVNESVSDTSEDVRAPVPAENQEVLSAITTVINAKAPKDRAARETLQLALNYLATVESDKPTTFGASKDLRAIPTIAQDFLNEQEDIALGADDKVMERVIGRARAVAIESKNEAYRAENQQQSARVQELNDIDKLSKAADAADEAGVPLYGEETTPPEPINYGRFATELTKYDEAVAAAEADVDQAQQVLDDKNTWENTAKLKQAQKVLGDARTARNQADIAAKRELRNSGDIASFSTVTGTPVGVAKSVVETVVTNYRRGWKSLPTVDIFTFDELTPANKKLFTGRKGGFMTIDGAPRIVLIADHLDSTEDAVATIYHEALGHFGLQQKYDAKKAAVMEAIYNTNDNVRRAATTEIAANPADYTGTDKFAKATEEVLAQMSEKGTIPQSALKRLAAMIRSIVRRMGMRLEFSDNDVVAILRQAHKAARSDTKAVVPSKDTDVKFSNSGVTKSPARQTASAVGMFNRDEIEKERRPAYKSRTKLIEMAIDDFLRLADHGDVRTKADDVQQLVDGGQKFASLPFLMIENDGRASGHEGRHRARALRAAGYKTMPVLLRSSNIRWSQQDDPDRYDYIEQWPSRIQAQEKAADPGFSIPFPVKQNEAELPYAGDNWDDTKNPDIRFRSVATMSMPTAKDIQTVISGAKDSNVVDKAKSFVLRNLTTLDQLVELAKQRAMPAFKQFQEAIARIDTHQKRWANSLAPTAAAWNSLDSAESERFKKLLIDAEAAHLRPDKPLKSAENQFGRDLSMWETESQMIEVYSGLVDRYNKLANPKNKALFGEVFDGGQKMIRETVDTMEAMVNRNISDPRDRAEIIAKIHDHWKDALAGRPWLPHKWFGEWKMTVTHADGRAELLSFETKAQAKHAKARLEAQGATADYFRNEQFYRQQSSVSRTALDDIMKAVDQNTKGTTNEILKRHIQEAYYSSLPETAGAQHMRQRKNTSGWEGGDLNQAWVQSMTAMARMTAKMRHMDTLRDAIDDAKRQSGRHEKAFVFSSWDGQPEHMVKKTLVPSTQTNFKAQIFTSAAELAAEKAKFSTDNFEVSTFDPAAGEDGVNGALKLVPDMNTRAKWIKTLKADAIKVQQDFKALRSDSETNEKNQQLVTALESRYEDLLKADSSHPVSTFMTSLGFVYYLGWTPAFAVMNMTQPWMITAPRLAGRFGGAKALSAMKVAYGTAYQNRDVMVKLMRSATLWQGESDVVDVANLKGVTDKQRAMLTNLLERGGMDFTQDSELHTLVRGTPKPIQMLMKSATWLAHPTEVMNRMVTALATYDLAVADGLSHEKAMDMAYDVTQETQMNYAPSNRMGALNSPIARPLLQFKQFGQQVTWMLIKAMRESFSDDPKVRKEQRAFLMYTLMSSGMIAGVTGLPFMGTALMLASALGGDDDEYFDARFELKEALGPIAANGLIGSWLTDWSRRTGLGDVLPFLGGGTSMVPSSGKTSDKLKQAAFDALGPAGGIARGGADALDYMSQGDSIRALEAALPKAMRDILKSGRYAARGVTSADGIIRVHGEEFSIFDLFAVAAGFKPSAEGAVTEKANYVYARQAFTALRAGTLAKQMIMAKEHGDFDDESEIQAKIDAFNDANPTSQITAKRISTAMHARENKQAISDMLHGLGFNNKDVALVKELGLDD